MNLAFDIHGVIDTNPEDFKGLFATIKKLVPSVKIFIVSGPTTKKLIEELNSLGLERRVHYDNVFSVVDFLIENKAEMWIDQHGNYWASDEDWWNSKGIICSMLNVDVLCDDSERYRTKCEELNIRFELYTKPL